MIEGKTVFAWIFARGGSKGLRRKNLALLDGKPLLGWAVETGLASRLVDEVFVSTDSEEIAAVARDFGASVPFLRPAALATDEAPERYAWRHAIEWCSSEGRHPMDILVSLPATVPLRNAEDVDCGIKHFAAGSWDTVLAVTESEAHPSFNLVHQEEDGAVRLISPPGDRITRRQDCFRAFRITGGVYVTAPDFVLRTESYWDGRVGAFQIPPERSVDIDGSLDLDWASFLLYKGRRKDGAPC